jgi:hypothetical protein
MPGSNGYLLMRFFIAKDSGFKLGRLHFITLASCIVLVASIAVSLYAHDKDAQLNKKPVIKLSNGIDAPEGMAWIPGGEFLMGSDHKLAQICKRS